MIQIILITRITVKVATWPGLLQHLQDCNQAELWGLFQKSCCKESYIINCHMTSFSHITVAHIHNQLQASTLLKGSFWQFAKLVWRKYSQRRD